MPSANIFTLPYELRYEIYRHYFTLEGGYAFQSKPGKLATVDGRPIDLALIYTCRLMAEETKDLPLRLNTISFSTVYQPEWSVWAGRFHYQLDLQASIRSDLLLSKVREVTSDMYSQIALKFPRFLPMLKDAQEHPAPPAPWCRHDFQFNVGVHRCLSETLGNWHRWRESASMINQAVSYTLRLITQAQGEEIPAWVDEEPATHDILGFLNKAYEPWDIPSKSELTAMSFELDDRSIWATIGRWRRKERWEKQRYREKFRFSAAAVAIQFLNSLPARVRLQLRKMVLHEDHVSVAHQERHARGLIPFCRENPGLRIERRVDVLNTIFQKSALRALMTLPISSQEEPNTRCELDSRWIAQIVAEWLLEGLATVDAGMPADAFTLVLDSGPAADLCSDVFHQVVHHKLAWQTALERCYNRGLLAAPSFDNPEYTFCEVSQDLWQALEHLSNQTSVLRCNFNPGQPWSVDKIFEECCTWDIRKWWLAWSFIPVAQSFPVLPPLPDWSDTLRENFELEPKNARSKSRKRHRAGGQGGIQNS
ncbi:hypothetical protein N0V84_007371 [Fusarium piperis]|uniref:Uncharacterized protein n=1 Tax=Fusarium piperis TaxID=1435070 RepID=A0A9W9BNQ1_9HYPO|nr:hypothetical protein N0V84_007371 [Fusarium piperis]